MASSSRTQPTPPRKTRAHPAVSYVEISGDSELESDSDTLSSNEEGAGKTRSTNAPRRSTRARARSTNQAADEEEDGVVFEADAQQSTPRRPIRSTRARHGAIRNILDEVEEEVFGGEVSTRVTRTSRAATSRQQEVIIISDTEDEGKASQSTPRRPTRANRARASPSKKRRRASSSDESDNNKYTPKRHKVARWAKRLQSKDDAGPAKNVIRGSGVIPAWQSLPYHVLVRILQYASGPLYDENTYNPTPSLTWLLNTKMLCRSFSEAGATVLLASPPLVPMTKAHGLGRLLKGDPGAFKYGYRQKVETLEIDVGQVAVYTLTGSGHLDLYNLIKDLPRLHNLEFVHQSDKSPFRSLNETIKWTYPEEVFKALEYVDPAANRERGDKVHICTLSSWRWSSRLAGKKYPINDLAKLHAKPYFQSLRKIAFVNYQEPVYKGEDEDPHHELALATAVKALPKLEHIIFESSGLLNSKLLPLLPPGLQQLELINCPHVTAEDLGSFLITHGRKMRTLVLNHNKALNLEFLPELGQACPSLQVLRMNLTFFNVHATYRDSEPQFDQLLLADQVPVWPSTLQVLELIQLRNWSTESAEMFFDSLLDSAGRLPDLRKLSIQAILNIAWRDRAAFRDKWVGELDRVFKRKCAPPLPIFTLPRKGEGETSDAKQHTKNASTEFNHLFAEASLNDVAAPSTSSTKSLLPSRSKATPAVRAVRSSTRRTKSGKYAESDSDSATEADHPSVSPTKRSTRGAGPSRLTREVENLLQTAGSDSPDIINLSSSSSDLSSADENGDKKGKGKKKGKQIVQGMCDTVEIRIDNLRPTENQATEADFLDEERSGDEDWDGED